jgi:hypothetical protein
MVVIDNIKLDDRCLWIKERSLDGGKGRRAEGVVLLVSVQNVQSQWNAWQMMIKALDPIPEKVIFCENDSSDETVKLIKSWDFPYELITFKSAKKDIKKDLYFNIAKNRQLLLDRVRVLKSKFAIFIDDDVFPNDFDIIEKLTKIKLPIVGGVYMRPFEDKGIFIASKWHLNTPLDELPPAIDLEKLVEDAKEHDSPYLMFSDCEDKLYNVAGTSAGCMCIRKDVLLDKRLNFFPRSIDLAEGGISEDFGYCLNAQRFGYDVYLDGGIRLEHLLPTTNRIRPWVL